MRLRIKIVVASLWTVSCSSSYDGGPYAAQARGGTESVRSAASAPAFERVWVATAPNADCKLHPIGVTDPKQTLTVYADERGLASFRALHPTSATDPGIPTHLSLDCVTVDGATVSDSIDLTDDATFRPPTVPENSLRRPALTGDPMSYSQLELIRDGFGLRPDPVKMPKLYASWAATAAKEGRLLSYNPGRLGARPEQALASTNWGGAGLARGQYAVAVASYPSPAIVAQQQSSELSIWGGLGGAINPFPNDQTIIQCGIQLRETNWAETTTAWVEYFSPTVVRACVNYPCAWPMIVDPYDSILSYSWACDSAGNVDPNGGYGCFYLADQSSNPVQILSCTSPNNHNVCFSVAQPSSFLGQTANFVIEKQDFPLTHYGSETMSAQAIDYFGNIRDFQSDRTIQWNLKNLSNQYLENASTTGAESLRFTWVQAQ